MGLKVERFSNRLTKAVTVGLLKWRELIARNAGGGHIEPAAASRCARSTIGRRYHETDDNARLRHSSWTFYGGSPDRGSPFGVCAIINISIYHYINNRSSGNSPRTWRCDGDDDVVQLQVLPCVSVRPPRRDLLPPWGWSRTPVCPGNAKRDGPTEMCKSPPPTIDDRKKVKGKKNNGFKRKFPVETTTQNVTDGPSEGRGRSVVVGVRGECAQRFGRTGGRTEVRSSIPADLKDSAANRLNIEGKSMSAAV